jgi:hypothetical protein
MQQQARVNQFWITWTLATVVGYVLGTLAILPWMVNLAYAAQPQWLLGLVGGALLGGAVGGAQWLVLRRYLLPVAGGWIWASIVGGTVGLGVGLAVADLLVLSTAGATTREALRQVGLLQVTLQAAVTGAIVGMGLGGAQWLALRNSTAGSGWWIFVSGLAWLVGMGVGALLADGLGVLGALLIAGLIIGAVTGLSLPGWLRRNRAAFTDASQSQILQS